MESWERTGRAIRLPYPGEIFANLSYPFIADYVKFLVELFLAGAQAFSSIGIASKG